MAAWRARPGGRLSLLVVTVLFGGIAFVAIRAGQWPPVTVQARFVSPDRSEVIVDVRTPPNAYCEYTVVRPDGSSSLTPLDSARVTVPVPLAGRYIVKVWCYMDNVGVAGQDEFTIPAPT
jgi:hypothetical protein